MVAGHDVDFISAHPIAETYTALIHLPVQPRIHPSEAARFSTGNIVSYCTAVPLTPEAYLQALAVVHLHRLPFAMPNDRIPDCHHS